MSCLCLLWGCTQSDEEKHFYENLNPKETYAEVIDYFNDFVSYYHCVYDGMEVMDRDVYDQGGYCSVVSKTYYEEEDSTYLDYTIVDHNQFHSLYYDEGAYHYQIMDDYSLNYDHMYIEPVDYDHNHIIDIERHEKDNGLEIVIRSKETTQYQETDEEHFVSYVIDTLFVNNNGFIEKEDIRYYSDESFEHRLDEYQTLVFSDFNRKESDDFEKEIDFMESCEGLDVHEIRDQMEISQD